MMRIRVSQCRRGLGLGLPSTRSVSQSKRSSQGEQSLLARMPYGLFCSESPDWSDPSLFSSPKSGELAVCQLEALWLDCGVIHPVAGGVRQERRAQASESGSESAK